jgi:hypothetical protein
MNGPQGSDASPSGGRSSAADVKQRDSSFQAPTITLPKGGDGIRRIEEKFAANPVTGTGSEGTFGLVLDLAARANTRKTDKGLPLYRDADGSDVFPLSSAALQIPVSSTPFVKSGQPISRGKDQVEGRGSAGLIVRKNGTTAGAQLLTCAHVLGAFAEGMGEAITNANLVYAPEYSSCCDLDCNKPIGTLMKEGLNVRGQEYSDTAHEVVLENLQTIGGTPFAVDAGLVALAADINSYNRMPELGQIEDQRDLIGEWALTIPPPPPLLGTATTPLPPPIALIPTRQILVKKFGATTKLTVGRIRQLAWKQVRANPTTINFALAFEIEAEPTSPPFVEEYEVDLSRHRKPGGQMTIAEVQAQFAGPHVTVTTGGSAKTPTLKIVARTFCQPGDSGSPIVDENQKVIGLVQSGLFKRLYVNGKENPMLISGGNAQGIFIRAIFEKLNVGFLKGGFHAAGAPIVVPGMLLERGVIDWSVANGLLARVEASPFGARIAAAGRRHASEIRQLIHHRRRVTVTWHRFKGPAFVVSFARATQQPSAPVSASIDGVRLIDAVRAMRNVLVAEGSLPLQASIAEHEDELFRLAECEVGMESLLSALSSIETTRS